MFLKIKILIAKLITMPWIGNLIRYFTRGKLKKYDLTFDTASPMMSSTNVAVLFWGMYESSEIRFIQKYFTDNSLDVIELGGSLGIVSSVISKQKGSERKHIIVEANPHLIDTINKNLTLNNAKNTTILNVALPMQSNSKEVYFEIGESSLVSKIVFEPNANTVAVPCKNLSNIIAENNISNFVLISDIEGAELGLLLNDSIALSKAKLIIIETHNTDFENSNYSTEWMKTQIIDLGYNIIDAHGPVYVFQKNA